MSSIKMMGENIDTLVDANLLKDFEEAPRRTTFRAVNMVQKTLSLIM